MTRLEVGLANLTGVVRDQTRLIAKLDDRADRQDVLYARLLAALVVIGGLIQVLAPALRELLRLPA